ncbi:Fis family transcriptional regulator [Agaribacter marinus]|uniref:Fis family transcriptional regulator n=1 Tax=Agaribacter marinus TaxID=1431249 RepID=A0AA37SY12_9ALTE|nr:Fis family transcriptional regulator [Agaribacter marinus]GLR71937.1 hypothetical protein GCM10007852_28450 [Agaribacter marinus]
MKKTIKKLENNIVNALTEVCETAKDDIDGFIWLTHTVDFSNFPSSLLITCVFDTNASLNNAKAEAQDTQLIKAIHKAMFRIGVVLKRPKHNVTFNTEEAGFKP